LFPYYQFLAISRDSTSIPIFGIHFS
jgi:hypothetical protein